VSLFFVYKVDPSDWVWAGPDMRPSP
jgi:hypothetical protein